MQAPKRHLGIPHIEYLDSRNLPSNTTSLSTLLRLFVLLSGHSRSIQIQDLKLSRFLKGIH